MNSAEEWVNSHREQIEEQRLRDNGVDWAFARSCDRMQSFIESMTTPLSTQEDIHRFRDLAFEREGLLHKKHFSQSRDLDLEREGVSAHRAWDRSARRIEEKKDRRAERIVAQDRYWRKKAIDAKRDRQIGGSDYAKSLREPMADTRIEDTAPPVERGIHFPALTLHRGYRIWTHQRKPAVWESRVMYEQGVL